MPIIDGNIERNMSLVDICLKYIANYFNVNKNRDSIDQNKSKHNTLTLSSEGERFSGN